MRVTKLVLTDYRGFVGTTMLEVPDSHVVVFAGENGAGKSSVLRAVAYLASAVPEMLEQRASVSNTLLGKADVRAGCGSGIVAWRLRWGFEPVVRWSLTLRRGETVKPSPEDGLKIRNQVEEAFSKVQPATPFPVLTYLHAGTTRAPARVATAEPRADRSDRLAAYDGAFEPEWQQFADFETWFVQEATVENAERVAHGDLRYEQRTLKVVRAAVDACLSALHATRFGRLNAVWTRLEGPSQPPTGRLTVEKGGTPLFVDQLSDGERRLVLLVADTARRCVIANPQLDDPLRSPGLLMVDEVEMHLHPLWQRRVIPALRAAFPEMQVLVTTHSPQVLASVPDESVVLMKDFKFLPGRPRVHGRDTNLILESVMGTSPRPEEVSERLGELYAWIEPHPRKAKKRLVELEKELGADDPDVVRARAMIEFLSA